MIQTIDVLTQQQIDDLRELFEQKRAEHAANGTELGLWVPVYEALYELVTDFSGVNGPIENVDRQSWLWLRGARFVNGGEGPDYNYKMTIYVGDDAYSTVRGIETEGVTSIVDSSELLNNLGHADVLYCRSWKFLAERAANNNDDVGQRIVA